MSAIIVEFDSDKMYRFVPEEGDNYVLDFSDDFVLIRNTHNDIIALFDKPLSVYFENSRGRL